MHHLLTLSLLSGSPQVIDALLFSTFVSWKTFFPLVRDDPNRTYTFITGGFDYCAYQQSDNLIKSGLGILFYT